MKGILLITKLTTLLAIPILSILWGIGNGYVQRPIREYISKDKLGNNSRKAHAFWFWSQFTIGVILGFLYGINTTWYEGLLTVVYTSFCFWLLFGAAARKTLTGIFFYPTNNRIDNWLDVRGLFGASIVFQFIVLVLTLSLLIAL